LCWCFIISLVTKHRFCCMISIGRSWRTWKTSHITPTYYVSRNITRLCLPVWVMHVYLCWVCHPQGSIGRQEWGGQARLGLCLNRGPWEGFDIGWRPLLCITASCYRVSRLAYSNYYTTCQCSMYILGLLSSTSPPTSCHPFRGVRVYPPHPHIYIYIYTSSCLLSKVHYRQTDRQSDRATECRAGLSTSSAAGQLGGVFFPPCPQRPGLVFPYVFSCPLLSRRTFHVQI
jgi:hypothetical protein